MIEICGEATSIFPGIFSDVEIDTETAKKLVAIGFVSSVTSAVISRIISTILEIDVPLCTASCNSSYRRTNMPALCLKIDRNKVTGFEKTEDLVNVGFTWRLFSPLMRIPNVGDRIFADITRNNNTKYMRVIETKIITKASECDGHFFIGDFAVNAVMAFADSDDEKPIQLRLSDITGIE